MRASAASRASTTTDMDDLDRITYEDIAATPLGQALGNIRGSAVANRLVPRAMSPGEALFRQGDAGDCLYVVLQGRLCALIANDSGTVQRLGEIGPGELVGETALLLGAPRSATVEAVEPTMVGALDVSAWRQLSAEFPGLEAAVARAADWREQTSEARRFRPDRAWISAWLARTELLAGAEGAALDALERELMWEALPAGEVLVRQGDAGECMWFVVRGRLRVSARQPDGSARTVGEVGPGECVGEMALLSQATRAATVKVVRDAELLRLPKSAFDRLAGAHPEAMLRLARAIVGRLQRTLGARPAQQTQRTVAILAAGRGVPLAAFAEMLSAELGRMTRTALLDGTAEARQAVTSDGSTPEVVVLVCDATATPWTTRCLRQADDIVVVARADGDPRPEPLEQEALASAVRREAGCRLVLLQPSDRPPSGTNAWLAARPGVRHYHVRPGRVADLARLARLLSGQAIGLALSGGGARGFAHIGVLKALHEAGVPVDMVAGTSMGAMVGAVHALGYAPDVMLDRCRAWTRERPWTDFTLPLASIVRGRRIRRALEHLLGDGRIEDLWLPYACMTSNLTRATADAHTEGPLVRLVLASNSVPGLAPPVYHLGDVHVDGGVMDNLPVSALRRMGAGCVIAVDVGTELHVAAPAGSDVSPSGWALLWDRLRRGPARLPPVFVSLTRAFTLASDERAQAACRDADLTLRPPLDRHAAGDFSHIDAIAEIGFADARERLRSFLVRAEDGQDRPSQHPSQ
jgi:predicted acylesterase/phospholipase RssA/CRP-like cAMP-binding protein